MSDNKRMLEIWCLPFQFTLVVTYLYRKWQFSEHYESLVLTVVSTIGFIMFVRCLDLLYLRRHRLKGLVVTDLFRYTRHPMYTGIFLMDVPNWFSENSLGWIGWISGVIFYVALCIAGYLQERETLIRFGDQAIAYYAKTPRIILWYPFIRLLYRPK